MIASMLVIGSQHIMLLSGLLDIYAHEADEFECAGLDIFWGQLLEARWAEFFDAVRCGNGAVNEGAFHGIEGSRVAVGEVADEAACEGVASAGGVEDFFEGEGGDVENLIILEEEGAVFAFFDDEGTGAHVTNDASGLDEGMLAGELAGFFVIDNEDVDLFEDGFEVVEGDLHPEVHGVHGHEFGAATELVENLELDGWGEVAEHEIIYIAVGFGEFGAIIFENVELGDEGIAGVHVEVIAASPEEGFFALAAFESVEVNASILEGLEFSFGEVFADNGD